MNGAKGEEMWCEIFPKRLKIKTFPLNVLRLFRNIQWLFPELNGMFSITYVLWPKGKTQFSEYTIRSIIIAKQQTGFAYRISYSSFRKPQNYLTEQVFRGNMKN